MTVRAAAVRAPARPASRGQVARRKRILDVAAEMAEELPFEQVQMADLAKRAEVALGTLYRYFPSKTQLFVEMFFEELDGVVDDWVPDPRLDGVGNVAARFAELTTTLLTRRRLTTAMVQCSTAGYATMSGAEVAMRQLPLYNAVLRLLGVTAPTSEHEARARLFQYLWWGVLVSILDDKTTPAEGDADIRLGARLVFGPDPAG